jgi:hypothetical protein
MQQKFLGNVMRMRICLLLLCAVVCPVLYGMEQFPAEVKKNILCRADYYAQRMFAQVSKANNAFMEEHCRPYKKRIKEFMAEKNTPIICGAVSWNYNFSRCAWVTIKSDFGERKSWGLTLVELSDNDTIVERNQKYIGFYFPAIEGEVRPFFNRYGDASFHGYADTWIKPMGYERMCQSIVEFTLDRYGLSNCCRCFIELEEDKGKVNAEEVYDFYYIFNFPVLMKAFLQSTQVRSYARDFKDGWDHAKYYDISGVTIPEDYKTYKQHSHFKCTSLSESYFDLTYDALTRTRRYPFSTYEAFPERLKKAIDKKYAEQQREKRIIRDITIEEIVMHVLFFVKLVNIGQQ